MALPVRVLVACTGCQWCDQVAFGEACQGGARTLDMGRDMGLEGVFPVGHEELSCQFDTEHLPCLTYPCNLPVEEVGVVKDHVKEVEK